MRDVLAECYRRLEAAEEAVVLMYEHLVPVDHPAECYDCDARLGEVGNVWGSARRHDAAREAFGERVRAALTRAMESYEGPNCPGNGRTCGEASCRIENCRCPGCPRCS